MKTVVKGAIRDQKGQVLILTMILLVVGGLILTPLLGLMSTGLMSGQVYENKMQEYYAADAGIEHGLWRLLNEEVANINLGVPYYLTDINEKEVAVTIKRAWLFDRGLSGLGLPTSEPLEGDPWYGNDDWTVTGAVNIENTSNYIIDMTGGDTDVYVSHIGVWLPEGYSYGGSAKINGVAIGEPSPSDGIPHKGGTVLIWEFDGVKFLDLSNLSIPAPGGCTPAEKFPPGVRLSFDYATVGSDYVVRVYDASGTFNPPAGVTNVTVEAWGGGGGGGGRSNSSSGGAGGGGGGAYARDTVSVTSGMTYTVTVGAAGAAGAGGNNPGGTGGDSWFATQSTVLAKGGNGGAGGAGGAGGSGGSAAASVGGVKYSGGNGAAGRSSYTYRSGGGGGGAGNATAGKNASGATGGDGGNEGGGDGADGRSSNGAGYSGSAPGGGGSGALRTSGGPYAGGNGASGKVILRYRTKEPELAKGFFSWVKVCDNANCDNGSRVAWDIHAGIYHIESRAATATDVATLEGTTVESYTVVSLSRYATGTGAAASCVRGDYIAIGNTLMTSCWRSSSTSGPPCSYTCSDECRNYRVSESSATVVNVPSDAQVEKAYLYWSAWRGSNNQPDTTAMLTVNGAPVTPTKPGDPVGTVVANRSYRQKNTSSACPNTYAYSSFADVTPQVKGGLAGGKIKDVTFTVGGVDCQNATQCGSGSGTCAFAGWSMILIYSSQENEPRQLYLYDSDFWYAPDDSAHEFTLTGFEAPVELSEIDGRVTCFVVEGDGGIQGREDLSFNSHKLTDSVNPTGNVWNSKSNVMGFTRSDVPGQPAGQISGLDLDTYSLSATHIDPGSTSAEVEARTGQDGWYMVYIMVSLRSTVVFSEGVEIGSMTYKIG